MSADFGNHRHRGTLRFLVYHALYQWTRSGFVNCVGSVKDGERFLGLHEVQIAFDPATMSADEAARADPCQYVDATVFGEGTLPQRVNWQYGGLTR